MAKSDKPIPEWAQNFIEVCSHALGLSHWTIYVSMARFNDPSRRGKARANTRYVHGQMILAEDLTDDAAGRHTIIHETIHLALGRLVDVFAAHVKSMSKAERARAWEVWSAAEEEVAELMSHGLLDVLKDKVWSAYTKPDHPTSPLEESQVTEADHAVQEPGAQAAP